MANKSVYKVDEPTAAVPKKSAVNASKADWVDNIIGGLLSPASSSFSQIVSNGDLTRLLDTAKQVFKEQPVMVEIEAPVKICGDVHGQYADVLRLFDRGGFPPLVNYLFLGDYVDRGPNSLEVITLFFAYKVKYPCNFFLLRGNHECAPINRVYGFYEECTRRIAGFGPNAYNMFQNAFAYMPLTGLVSQKILCMHGGISCKIRGLDSLRRIARPISEVCPQSLENDLLWSDPDDSIQGFEESTRGVGSVFGVDVLHGCIRDLQIDLVARAHQVVQDGYEFFGNKKLVTIFSAPHYCGSFNNAAAVMNVDTNLTCSFQVFRAVQKAIK